MRESWYVRWCTKKLFMFLVRIRKSLQTIHISKQFIGCIKIINHGPFTFHLAMLEQMLHISGHTCPLWRKEPEKCLFHLWLFPSYQPLIKTSEINTFVNNILFSFMANHYDPLLPLSCMACLPHQIWKSLNPFLSYL